MKSIATPEIIEEVSLLRHKQGTGDLRKVITDLVTELEKDTNNTGASNLDMASIERSVKTLAILIELLFSLE